MSRKRLAQSVELRKLIEELASYDNSDVMPLPRSYTLLAHLLLLSERLDALEEEARR